MSLDIEGLIGKPYLRNGRGPDTYDCAGLVVEVLRRRGIQMDIPATSESETRNAISMQRILHARWCDVDMPFPGCLVFFRPNHVGVMVTRNSFIHAAEDVGQVCIERLDSPLWRSRFAGFYEYGGIAA